MKYTILGGACVVTWIIVAFVIPLQSGWAHLPLGAGVILIGMGIVIASEKRD
ncbi:MAG: hypothetical protein O7I93_14690 [Gemmatimonadetes bacterium]|nr:hypothetical protein [Gemmatimonadota bacterium]